MWKNVLAHFRTPPPPCLTDTQLVGYALDLLEGVEKSVYKFHKTRRLTNPVVSLVGAYLEDN